MSIMESLAKRRGWSKTKMEWFRISLIFGIYVFLIFILVSFGYFDYQCRLKLPSGDLVNIPVNDPEIPNVSTILVKLPNLTTNNCTYITHCYETLQCNFSTIEECWNEPFC